MGERIPLWDRFWPKVDGQGDCWEWLAAKNEWGYGHIRLPGGRSLGLAHRVAWELLIGPIPSGLEIDHLCRNPGCVNPDHLEPVTHLLNMLRAPRPAPTLNKVKTHCPEGHPYSGENLYEHPRGGRQCRACKVARQKLRRAAHIGLHLGALRVLPSK